MWKKIWLLQVPLIGFFTFSFWVTDLGVQGKLENLFLREKIHPFLSRAVNQLTDAKFLIRGAQEPKNKIIVIEIDSSSIERLGRWPWHRDIIAYLIEKIFLAGAKVIGLDMVFSEPDPRVPNSLKDLLQKKGEIDTTQYETDPQLKEVIQAYSDRLITGWTSEMSCQPLYEEEKFCPVTDPEALKLFPPSFQKFSFDEFITQVKFNPAKTAMISFVTPIPNIPEYNEVSKHSGYLNAILDSDGAIRRSNLLVFAKGIPFPSLALQMAKLGLNEKIQVSLNQDSKVESLGFINTKRMISVTPLGSMQINFKGPSSVFSHISAEEMMNEKDIIEDPTNLLLFGKSKNKILKDAYVLIGLSALGVFDMRKFPFESNSPGVYGHANLLENILTGDPLITNSKQGSLFLLFLMIFGVFGFSILIEKLNAIPALSFFIATLSLILLLDFKVLFNKNYNLNSIYFYFEIISVFIFTLSAKYVREEKNKKFIRGAFSKYVSPSIVDLILKDPSRLSLGGEKKELSILFSDIRNFTTFSEKMDAKILTSFLNEYLGCMTEIIFCQQGTLDKYMGDAIMAFWGAPLEQKQHAFHSCQTAIKMLKALEQNQKRWKDLYEIDVRIGIGINSGIVNVGNMGSEKNFEYTVIGDHVNLASRIEGLTKKYHVPLITTRLTLESIEKSGLKLPSYRTLDQVKVKGKNAKTELIQLLEKDYPSEGLCLFEEGRQLYQMKKWQEAIKKFSRAQQEIQKTLKIIDGPCEIYLERCQQLEKSPPELNWDGTWEFI